MAGRKAAGRKAAGRGGRGAGRGRGAGGRGSGRDGSMPRHVGGGRTGGRTGLYSPDDGDAEFVALRGGGVPKRKHLQMFGAYGTPTGGHVRKPDDDDDDDSDDSEVDSDIDEENLPSGSEDESLDDDPNVNTARVMRVGGIEIRLDDRGDKSRRAARRVVPLPDRDEAEDGEDEDDGDADFFDSDDDSEEWGSELSLDDDAIRDYMRNCMEGSESSGSEGVDDVAKTEKKLKKQAREDAYLRSMRDMNLSRDEVPSPPLSGDDFSLDSQSEDENELLKGGNYGKYTWSRGDVVTRGPERVTGPSGKRAAKKAAKASAKRGESPTRCKQTLLPRPGAVAETLRMMILSGGSYVGFQPVKSHEALQSLAKIADAFGLAVELTGGGKRKHPVVRWTPRAFVPKADDERVQRAVAQAGGDGYTPGGNWEGYDTAAGKGQGHTRRERGRGGRDFEKTLASNFRSAGVMRDGGDDETNENETETETEKSSDDFETELDATETTETAPLMDTANLQIDVASLSTAMDASEVELRSEFQGLGSGAPTGGLGIFETPDVRAALARSAGVEALDETEQDRDAVAIATSKTNRGLRRAAIAAEREAKLLESRRKKLGFHVPAGGGDLAGKKVVGAGEKFGDFEKHTSGFGSRMLAKMGFRGEGSGVGKAEQGIAEPITAVMRARKVGLGAEKKR